MRRGRRTLPTSRSSARALIPTVYLGTSEFAATVLHRLAGSRHRPALVLTPPDRRRGRGRQMASPPAADTARELGIELLQAESVNDPEPLARIRATGADAAVVCAFGQLIREPLLSEVEMLNVHPSLIPRWRGAAPIERAIISGDERTGVTIMRVTEGLDSGPVALQEEVEIDPDDDYGSLSGRLAELGGALVLRALGDRAAGSLSYSEQDDERATYAEKIDPAERHLDPAEPAAALARTVRALSPHIGTYIELEGGQRLGVLRAAAAEGGPPSGSLEPADGALALGTAEGTLRLEVVQPPGKRPMDAEAYLRGHEAPRRAL